MEPEPAEHRCPHCGGPLYPSREQKMRRANFYSQVAAIITNRRHDGACRGVASVVMVGPAGVACQPNRRIGSHRWLPRFGLALIDGKLWKMLLEQSRHNKQVEKLLAAMRDRMPHSA
jgi:hypothetical protein